jgi:hypothetical protein
MMFKLCKSSAYKKAGKYQEHHSLLHGGKFGPNLQVCSYWPCYPLCAQHL